MEKRDFYYLGAGAVAGGLFAYILRNSLVMNEVENGGSLKYDAMETKPLEATDVRECLADQQHAIWSHWMRYMFTCGKFDAGIG